MQAARRTRRAAAVAAAVTLALTAAGCGSDDDSGEAKKEKAPAKENSVSLPNLKGQKLTLAAIWTGPEQKRFTKVLDEFEKRTGAEVTFQPTGDNVATFLGSKVEGGQPPDVAMLPQVGVLHEFAKKGWVKPAGPETVAQLEKNFTKGWKDLGAYEGKQYGVYYKVANKSLVWYNTSIFADAGVSEPKTWDEFKTTVQTVSDYGVEPLSVGGADGWVLTDWFENIYLSQAGPEKYDQLAAHKIKWTDPSVTTALNTLAEVLGKQEYLAGGVKKTLQTEFPASITQTFAKEPKAGMVYEGDFVANFIEKETKAKVGTDAKVFPFPAVGGEAPVVSAGDVAVVMKESEGAQALLTFLASTDGAEIWAKQGGYTSPNKELDLNSYPDEISKKIAKALIDAGDDFRFDMSDQAPGAFGGTKGRGEWKRLQDFLKNPKDVKNIQAQLEADAAKAYKNAG
ncbi:sugar ABC transporter substrate-binding protein [Wenjunlia vitaminophila]|uniref:Sugar ABC transporter substrate-binding protein n=1 Tax=Wenjunlia vitaminophila TaxID=76728 RepID=A0A0T6LNK0_WENVI|nr:ABC transporter substrate-binding protein [Wenjunlia vitaminophila]KRV47671.1 sugar ABC transporter substrate-binding protein [Wenjunlia vitaminophila]